MEASSLELSVVSPVYQAGEMVEELVGRVSEAAARLTDRFEIVLVDDCSHDDSWSRIQQAAKRDPRLRGARLSRNFGQHAAITAALSLARGKRVVLMDCDLQHNPAEIPRLWAKANEGFDIVLAYHAERKHAWHRNCGAKVFRWLNIWFSGRSQPDGCLGTFSLLNRKVVNAFLEYREIHRHYLNILHSAGFRVGRVEVHHCERSAGKSSYSTRNLIRHAIHGMLGQSDRLLYLALVMGLAFSVFSVLGIIYVFVVFAVSGLLAGWASLVVLLLGSTGLILFTLGVLGLHIGGIFEQVRARPIFIIDETTP